MIEQHSLAIETKGKSELVDLTPMLDAIITGSKIRSGQVLVFVPGSTAGITTIEYEPGLLHDFPALMEKLVPLKGHYDHNERWGDGNGYAHLRASMIGPSLVLPISSRKLVRGTWQQIVFCEFDNRPRQRQIIIQIMGE